MKELTELPETSSRLQDFTFLLKTWKRGNTVSTREYKNNKPAKRKWTLQGKRMAPVRKLPQRISRISGESLLNLFDFGCDIHVYFSYETCMFNSIFCCTFKRFLFAGSFRALLRGLIRKISGTGWVHFGKIGAQFLLFITLSVFIHTGEYLTCLHWGWIMTGITKVTTDWKRKW